jgi:hypothetical protein
MNTSTRPPSPAIVSQDAVRRFPIWALRFIGLFYILAGFVGREPWKSEDIAQFVRVLAFLGASATSIPEAYWLVARVIAAALLGLTFICTWYGTYYLARRDAAQPVPFAFGGEAQPTHYASAIADGALLALIACLGLAQLSHETTAALLQLTLVGLLFFAISAYRYHPYKSVFSLILSSLGLVFFLPGLTLQWHQLMDFKNWLRVLQLLAWFAWPAWILALLALVKWRRHWLCKRPATHILLPLVIVAIHAILLPLANQPDRWFLSALPALACLAAFALPTMKRSLKSLIDLFTLLFFSTCGLVIWVVWMALETGIPPQPAANVARLAPLFTPSYAMPVVLLAIAASVAWVWLVAWRLGRHRPAIWMSMVLPAGGAALCWFLLMSLWLPLLDHARSYQPLMAQIRPILSSLPSGCLQTHGLSRAQRAALRYYIKLPLVDASRGMECHWLIADGQGLANMPEYVVPSHWQQKAKLRRPTDDNEDWLIYERVLPNAPTAR